VPSTLTPLVKFANFEVDVRAGELRRDGSKVRLQEQPFLLLTVVIESAGSSSLVKNSANAFGRWIPSSISTIA